MLHVVFCSSFTDHLLFFSFSPLSPSWEGLIEEVTNQVAMLVGAHREAMKAGLGCDYNISVQIKHPLIPSCCSQSFHSPKACIFLTVIDSACFV